MQKITVIGSAIMDLVGRAPKFPAPGETVIGSTFSTHSGGKGANQAVAASKLGCCVSFIGCVGIDLYGDQLIDSLRSANVCVDHVKRTESLPTGVALISVQEKSGENSIMVLPGANSALTPSDIDKCEDIIANASILVCSLEVPIETVHRALEIAKRHGVKTILNPAPAQDLSSELLSLVDIITPNEHEVVTVSKVTNPAYDDASMKLISQGVGCVVITLGDLGAAIFDDMYSPRTHIFASEVQNVVDTTAAGDCFTGALAVAVAEGKSIECAVKFATVAAGISVTRHGAQTSLPTRSEVDKALNSH